MKVFSRGIVISSLFFTLNVNALGLGDIVIHSSLNQPFNAEIPLLDSENIPASAIHVKLASIEDFERADLERAYGLSALTFLVDEDSSGQRVVKVRSKERMEEPFLQLLIDLTWANGQVYRAYTVLLDPADYELPAAQGMSAPVDQRSRSKEVEVATAQREQSPKQAILLEEELVISTIPVVPTLSPPRVDPASVNPEPSSASSLGKEIFSRQDEPVKSKRSIEVDLAAQAIEAAREANNLLKEQLLVLQSENKLLHQQLASRDAEIKQLQQQVTLLISRQGIVGQASSQQPLEDDESIWRWVMLFMLLSAGGCFLYWWYFGRFERLHKDESLSSEHDKPYAPFNADKPEMHLDAEGSESSAPEVDVVEEQSVTIEKEPEMAAVVEEVEIKAAETPVVEEETDVASLEVETELQTPTAEEQTKVESIEIEAEVETPAVEEETKVESIEIEAEVETPTAEEETKGESLEVETEVETASVEEETELESIEVETEAETPGVEEETKVESIEPESETPPVVKEDTDPDKEPELEAIEFDVEIKDEQEVEEELAESSQVDENSPYKSVDFGTPDEAVEEEKASASDDEETAPESDKVVDTLLDLGRTYIEMEDFEAAKQSLDEVIQNGTEAQKEAAQKLLDSLDKEE